MRILFDLEPIWQLKTSGVFIYARTILDAWHECGAQDVTILTNQHLQDYCKKRWPNYPVSVVKSYDAGLTKKGLITGLRRAWTIHNSGADVVFMPIPEPFFFWPTGVPEVVTIHDVYGEDYAVGNYKRAHHYLFPKLFKRACKLVAISNITKREIQKKYNWIPDSKIFVNYNGFKFDNEDFPRWFDGEYILNVNNLDSYKNPETLIKAFARIKDKINHSLIIVGKNERGRWMELRALASELDVESRVLFYENLSKSELFSLYQHASLFVSPSSIEGFGQTPIEAAMCKCPVIVSSCPTLLETTQGLVHHYDSIFDDEVLADKMIEVLNNPPSETELQRISDKYRELYDYKTQGTKIYNLLKDLPPSP